jgi:sarcosine oxidase/L-pipecolate oxidase
MGASRLSLLALVAAAASAQPAGKNQSVIIIGGGTIGLSTAYWLSKDPTTYYSVKILDPYPAPSFASAGWDINKIAHAEHSDPMYSYIADEALSLWKSDGIFAPSFVKSGYISGTFDANGSEWVRNTTTC